MKNTFRTSIRAFTLVELLVVIVIIGILAGIALPVFQKAQEKARAVSDLSNLRQLGVGVQAYKGDNSGEILGSDGNGKWPQKLNPVYVSSWKVFKSPFDNRANSEIAASAPVSYGINDEAPVGNGGKLLGVDSSKINFPSNLVLMSSAVNQADTAVSYKSTNVGTFDVVVNVPTTKDRGTHQNRMRVNVVYADGHAEDVPWVKLMDKTTDDGKKRWVYDTPSS